MKTVQEVIRNLAGGTIFSVVFIKRTTGERREMVCRLGTSGKVKGEAGSGPAYDSESRGLLPVWDMQRQGWRSIPLESVERIKVRGEVYEWEPKQ